MRREGVGPSLSPLLCPLIHTDQCTLMLTFDFSRSFLTFQMDLQKQPMITLSHKPPTTLNNARIQLEARCLLTEIRSGKSKEYVLGASCKTERVGADCEIWTIPNADFCPVVSQDEFLTIKSWQKRDMGVRLQPPSHGRQPERQSGSTRDAWANLRIDLFPVEGEVLDSFEAINTATLSNRRLVSRIEYEDGGYHVCIDHPVKTMNVSDRERVYQTDTGPILLPDFSPERNTRMLIEHFDLAFAAVNAPDWAEFVINVPTSLTPDISVNHYSQTRRIENTRNTYIALP